jgi:hypothetical protein
VPFIPRPENLGFSGSYIIKGSNFLREVLSASKNQKSFIIKERRLFDVYSKTFLCNLFNVLISELL